MCLTYLQDLRSRYSFPLTKNRHSDIRISQGKPCSPSETLLISNSNEALEVPICLKTTSKQVSFITQDELRSIQEVIHGAIVPSHITKLTPRFGEKSNGKLKADEWRSLFTVYLPISALLMWHNRPDHMIHLKALLFLVILVQIATSQTSSNAAITLYGDTIVNYLNVIRAVYPQHQFTVNHHLALHLSFFMTLHGPCHSHWAFPFERLIGRLQKTLFNNQIGLSNPHYLPLADFVIDSMAGSMFRMFLSRETLALLVRQGVQTATLPQWEQPHVPHKKDGKRTYLGEDVRRQLSQRLGPVAGWANIVKGVTLGGLRFDAGNADKAASNFPGSVVWKDKRPKNNSLIGFYSEDQRSYLVGQIQEIVKVTVDQGSNQVVVFVVRCFGTPHATSFSPYLWASQLAHPVLGMLLVSTDYEPGVMHVPFNDVVGHVAAFPIIAPDGNTALITIQLVKVCRIYCNKSMLTNPRTST